MYNYGILTDLKRLNFENFLWIIFAILCFMNIYGDYNDKEYLKTKQAIFKRKSNTIFETTLIVTFFIYLYFLLRNYKAYEKTVDKNLYSIKLLGSSFLIAGVLCLIYFQFNQKEFIGSPAI
jgi:magnesium-transporting ATPase (P-type)